MKLRFKYRASLPICPTERGTAILESYIPSTQAQWTLGPQSCLFSCASVPSQLASLSQEAANSDCAWVAELHLKSLADEGDHCFQSMGKGKLYSPSLLSWQLALSSSFQGTMNKPNKGVLWLVFGSHSCQ